MTINSAQQAVTEAERTRTNPPGLCQLITRGWFNAPSVGDQDGDKDADAVDGWVSEPTWARHPGDRNPPVGAPVAFSGGSKGYGHRAIAKALHGILRSTDMFNGRYVAGVTGNATIEQIEHSMGVNYLGWSETISGYPIPGLLPETPDKPKRPKHTKVARAHRLVERALIRAEAKGQTKRAAALRRALKHLPEF